MKRKHCPRTLPVGTISEGTLRYDDLIPALLDAVNSIRLTKDERRAMNALARDWDQLVDACEAQDRDIEAADAVGGMMMELENTLNDHCPPYCYFGALEGDGACFGVWVDDNALAEAMRDGHMVFQDRNGAAEYLLDDGRYRLVFSDHGNRSLYLRNGHELWGVV